MYTGGMIRDETGVEVRVRPWRDLVLYSQNHGKLLNILSILGWAFSGKVGHLT